MECREEEGNEKGMEIEWAGERRRWKDKSI